jgi:hypothetical protein
MHRLILSISLTVFILFIFPACDHGLKPTGVNSEKRTGITGYISYQNWPTPDSLVDLRLVIFRYNPPDNILTEVLSGNAIVHPGLNDSSLPFYEDTTEFVVELDPGVYEYVVVAQQYGPNISADWLAAGQYDTVMADPLPTNITVEPGKLLMDININVDFNDLPLQPF